MGKIKFRDFKGIYTDRDTTDTAPEYLYDSHNIRYESGYCETEQYQSSPVYSGSGIDSVCHGYMGEDRIRVKSASTDLIPTVVIIEKSFVSSFNTWTIKYIINGTTTIAGTITDKLNTQGKSSIANEHGIFKIFLPCGIYRLGKIRSDICLTDIHSIAEGTFVLPTISTDAVIESSSYCRRVTILRVNKDGQDRYISFFARCDSKGTLVTGSQSISVLNLPKVIYKKWSVLDGKTCYAITDGIYKHAKNFPTSNSAYRYEALGGESQISTKPVFITSNNCIVAVKNISIVPFGDEYLFSDRDNDNNEKIDNDSGDVTSFKSLDYGTSFTFSDELAINSAYLNATIGARTITGSDYYKYVYAFVMLGLGGTVSTVDGSGFTVKQNYLATMVLDGKDEVFLAKGTIGETGKTFQIILNYSSLLPNPLVTRYNFYIKSQIFNVGVEMEDKASDYELCNSWNLLLEGSDAYLNKKSIVDSDRQGTYLTQALGTFYDENYRMVKKIDDYCMVDGMSFALSGSDVIPATIGGGKIMSNIFYYTNRLDLPDGDRIIRIATINSMLAICTIKKIYLILRQDAGGVQIYKIKTTLDLAIKDRYGLCYKSGNAIVLSTQGIFITNGFEQTLVSQAINRTVKDSGGRIFYNPTMQELYYLRCGTIVYRYKFSNGYWDILNFFGNPILEKLSEDHDGTLLQITSSAINKIIYTKRANAYMQFQETDLGDLPSLKLPMYINLDISVHSQVSETSMIRIGLNRMCETGGQTYFTYLYAPVKYYDYALKTWVNNFLGRKTLRVAVPVEKWYKLESGILSDVDGLKDMNKWLAVKMNVPGATLDAEDVNKFSLPYRQPVNRLYMTIEILDMEVKIYNIELEYDILRTMAVSKNKRIGYGKHYAKCYGKFL